MPEFQITTQTSLIAFVGIFMFLGGTLFLLFGLGVIRSGEGKDISFKIESGRKTTIIGVSGMLIGGVAILWTSVIESPPTPPQTPATSISPISTVQPVEIISSPTLDQIPATLLPQDVALNSSINDGFEKEFDSDLWKINGTMGFLQIGHSGEYALYSIQSLSPSDSFQWAGLSQHIEVTENQNYIFSVWLKWERAINPHISVQWYDESHAELGNRVMVWGFGDEWGTNLWEQKSGEIKAPNNAKFADVYILHGVNLQYISAKNENGSKLLVDDIIFSPK